MPEPPGDEPTYLHLEDALELYAAIINGTPAQAADHLRDRNGLEGALARPATCAHYQEADLALQAAVLAHGIAEGQFYIDGNKRLALVAMLTFLEVNGYRVEASDPELAEWILELAADKGPDALAETDSSSTRPIEGEVMLTPSLTPFFCLTRALGREPTFAVRARNERTPYGPSRAAWVSRLALTSGSSLSVGSRRLVWCTPRCTLCKLHVLQAKRGASGSRPASSSPPSASGGRALPRGPCWARR